MKPADRRSRLLPISGLLLAALLVLVAGPREPSAQPNSAVEAVELENQGRDLYQQGRYKEAEKLFQRALAIREKTLGPAHVDIVSSLNNLALIYQNQGRLTEAEPLFKRAVAITERTLGTEHANFVISLNNLANVYYLQGRLAEAEPLYKRTLAIREKAQGSEEVDVAVGLSNLATVYLVQGRLAEAEPLLKRALTIWEKTLGSEHPHFATSLNNLASIYYNRGRLAEAEPLYKRVLAIREKAQGAEHADVAGSLNNLANLYEAQRRHADSEPLLKRALAIWEKALGPEHPNVAAGLNNLANIYHYQGRLAEAEPLIRRSLAIKEKAMGPEHPDVAASLINLANLYSAQGQHAEAEPLIKRALALREKALGLEHPDVAQSVHNLGSCYEAQGRYAEAEPLLKRALAIWQKALGLEHPNVARTHMLLAQMSIKAGRDEDAVDSLRAIAAINRKLSAVVDDRAAEGAGGEIRFSDNILVLFALLADRQRDPTERAALAAEAFEAVQLTGARSTSMAVARMAARQASGSDRLASLVRQRQDAIDRHRVIDKALLAAVAKPPGPGDAQEKQRLRNDLAESDRRIAGLDARLTREFPRYAEIASLAPVSIKDVQTLLGPDEAMLVYRSAPNWMLKDTTFLWIVRRDQAELLKLPLGSIALHGTVASLRVTLDPSELDTHQPFDFNAATSYDLYSSVLAPAAPHLQGVRHLLIVPDSALQSLPFGVLITDNPGPSGSGSQTRWLIRQYAITTLPAVSSLRALRAFAVAGGKAREPFAGFGDPVLEGRPGDRKGLKVASLYRGIIADANAVRTLDALPETAGELRAIAKALGSKGDAIWLRARATEAQAKKADLSKYRVLAFATHGLMADQFRDYGEPALVMTPPKVASEADDGLLGASEITQLKLNADWVILSACNTAAPDGAPGAEGLSGLAKAFFYAGARSLLVSHWPVESESSAKLTTGAITALVKEPGIGRAEALRRSMLALMDDPKYAHPMFWAPFVVVGEGGAGR